MKLAKALAPAALLALAFAAPARAVTVTKVDDLAFGAVLSGMGGSVSVPSSTGVASDTGVRLRGSQFPQPGAASFDVLNDTASAQTYTLTLQSSPTDLDGIALSIAAPSQGSVTLNPGQSARIYVGGTLSLSGALVASGAHAATVPLTLLAQ